MADHNQPVFKCRDPQHGNPRCGKPRSEAALEATIADAVEVCTINLVVVTNVQLVTDQHEPIGKSSEKNGRKKTLNRSPQPPSPTVGLMTLDRVYQRHYLARMRTQWGIILSYESFSESPKPSNVSQGECDRLPRSRENNWRLQDGLAPLQVQEEEEHLGGG